MFIFNPSYLSFVNRLLNRYTPDLLRCKLIGSLVQSRRGNRADTCVSRAVQLKIHETEMSSTELPVEWKPLHVPPLEELQDVLSKALKDNFADVEVNVVDCPDLSQPPFHLATPGLCGQPRLADIGGVPFLVPLVHKDRIYDLASIPKLCDMESPNLVIGAGAGPWPWVGKNCEMMANLKNEADNSVVNGTRLAALNETDDACRLLQPPTEETRCAVLANVLISQGLCGKVLEIKCAKRTGETNYVTCMRQALAAYYGDQPVGLGGCFLIEKGQAKFHIMPDFSSTPLKSDQDVENWLYFFNAKAPLVCLSVFVSHDPDLDLRVEHSHGFSTHGEGGHYHKDVTPEEVVYRGYYVPAERIYRVDRPTETHQVGRD